MLELRGNAVKKLSKEELRAIKKTAKTKNNRAVELLATMALRGFDAEEKLLKLKEEGKI